MMTDSSMSSFIPAVRTSIYLLVLNKEACCGLGSCLARIELYLIPEMQLVKFSYVNGTPEKYSF